MPKVEAVCTSPRPAEPKQPVESAVFRADHGIQGDAHAGDWHRQVSLLAAEDIETVRRRLPDLRPGAFAENVVVSGLDLAPVGLGTCLRLGRDVVLSVTQIGKVCHVPCRIAEATGDCIMPRLGLFARVESGGEVRPGDDAEIVSLIGRARFQAVVLTVSDRCSRGEAEDTAGPAVARRIEEALHAHVYRLAIVPDEREQISARLRHYADGHSIDLVLTVGGTGFSPRDSTPEATRAVLDRPAPGLDEAMRAAGLARTPRAMLSRGASGIRAQTLIVNLPGSERAAVENLEAILDALPHGLEKLRGDPSPCGPAGGAAAQPCSAKAATQGGGEGEAGPPEARPRAR
jgi:molybdenum cofactor synthesis domain-containing protein